MYMYTHICICRCELLDAGSAARGDAPHLRAPGKEQRTIV